jgi:hypothetical protein
MSNNVKSTPQGRNSMKFALVIASGLLALAIPLQQVQASDTPNPTPSPTSSSQAALFEYKAALDSYKNALADYQAGKATGALEFQSLTQQYIALVDDYRNQIKMINNALKDDIDQARSDYHSAYISATTPAQKATAKITRDLAIVTATKTHDDAITQLGTAPVRPTKISPLKTAKLAKPNK